ncbi:DUF4031 domain-containing protein [Pseudarthrobacter sp. NIBRBAC000502770]|uniref:DUF4031 domain-containing protein n=1 Tax=Pseudarthrobacter sp. NIBRBAC000502770 TaxID=2590785 RepID=UPI00113FD23E|nr:DUF4031 domain-containing protein [Pseudarthrobacter sp. NIBRBAC000502770]QDG87132.1 DUF4031 domain-containing protein [Pseudarthrobacter sp. NIBRBAC000502770]
MTVYVDDAYIPAAVRSGPLTHDTCWCHLTADSTEELVAFATSIGLQAKYIQYPGTWKEHFDVTEPKRRQAVAKGAVEVSARDRVMQMAERRMRATE